MNPTNEQQKAIDLFKTGNQLAIEAGAGTGKTSTLVMIANSTTRRGQYIAFNKAIVVEAATKMPPHVACSTAHSLAFRAVGRTYAHRLNSGRMRGDQIASRVGLGALQITVDGKSKTMAAGALAGRVMAAVGRFCQTADMEPTVKHIEYVDGIDLPDPVTGRRSYENNNRLQRHLLPFVVRAWADLMDPNGSLPFKHDHYLKAWQLSGPRIEADFILFDEAQDANPVMLAVVAAQTHAQLVFVGDSQQAIYEFTGAVNALANLPVEARAYLTQSFRFGPAVAEVANGILGDLEAPLRLKGHEPIASTVAPVPAPTAYLTRTNASAVKYLLNCMAADLQGHLVGGGADVINFCRATLDLQSGRPTQHPDLQMFDSWAEVQSYVELEEEGADLKLLVKLMDEFGPARIMDALQHMPVEEKADVVISTAHKSKGREWDTVKLADDFNPFISKKNGEPPAAGELRLLYVAATRARLVLDCGDVALLAARHMAPPAAVEAPLAAAPAAPAPAVEDEEDAPSATVWAWGPRR